MYHRADWRYQCHVPSCRLEVPVPCTIVQTGGTNRCILRTQGHVRTLEAAPFAVVQTGGNSGGTCAYCTGGSASCRVHIGGSAICRMQLGGCGICVISGRGMVRAPHIGGSAMYGIYIDGSTKCTLLRQGHVRMLYRNAMYRMKLKGTGRCGGGWRQRYLPYAGGIGICRVQL